MAAGNSLGLFGEDGTFEAIDLPDADIRLMRGFYTEAEADRQFEILLRDTAWRADTITVWGKEYPQPRLTAWYGDPGADYTYSGLRMQALPWSPALGKIKADIEAKSGTRFNSVLINLYRNEHDSVGWHSDDEPELGAMPLIASLSLGATRRFKLKYKKGHRNKPFALDLTHGSLLLMGGDTQRYWSHAVEKERLSVGPRINLTFRTIFAPAPPAP
ncbi:MAG TPA: alpha-ketoglutarate-dependent dioxygenase AlkB [Burkholderiaceae bacterium]|jgi:alkylated DNA repair dioxygenase AlkB